MVLVAEVSTHQRVKCFARPNLKSSSPADCVAQSKKTCYYNDTYAGKVHAIPCDPETGLPNAKAQWRTVVELDADKEGAPDGLAIDRDGNLWVAHEQGGQVRQHCAALRQPGR